jgi:mxaD protein
MQRKTTMKNMLLALSVLAFSLPVLADGAKKLHAEESVSIAAPAEAVWSKVNNFGDLGAWHPAVKTTQITAGENNKKGAIRLLTLQDGGTVQEKLLGYSANKKSFQYAIIEGVLPVSSYTSTVTVKADTPTSSTVVWSGNFKRKDTSATPAAGQDDDTAVKTITSVYRGGLDNLKKISETK